MYIYSRLLFKKINLSADSSVNLFLKSVIILEAELNTRSEGTDVPCISKYDFATVEMDGYKLEFIFHHSNGHISKSIVGTDKY